MYTVLLVIHTIIVLFLIGIVLIQRSESDGMSGLGGGGGGGGNFMTGRAAANLLTRTTAILAAVFMATSLALAVMSSRITQTSIVDQASVRKNAEAPAILPKTKPAATGAAQPAPAVPLPSEPGQAAPMQAAPVQAAPVQAAPAAPKKPEASPAIPQPE